MLVGVHETTFIHRMCRPCHARGWPKRNSFAFSRMRHLYASIQVAYKGSEQAENVEQTESVEQAAAA